MKHLRIGGSTIARTLQCPAWVKRSENVPAGQSNVAADIGSLLHKTMEIIEKDDVTFLDKLIGKVEHNGQVLTRELIEGPVKAAADMVDDIRFNNSAFNIYPEIFVELVADEIGGTIDVLLHSEEHNQVWVIDYKFGRAPVEKHKNPQLMFYAMCALNDSKTKHLFNDKTQVITTVIQPYCSGAPYHYQTNYTELVSLEGKVKSAVAEANSPNPSATAGKECKYCPYQHLCPEYTEFVTLKLGNCRDSSLGEAERLAKSLKLALEVERWAKEVKERAREEAIKGVNIKGFDLIEGRKKRTWKRNTEKEIVNILGDSAYTKDLITPAKALKLSGVDKELLEKLIEESKEQPRLVPEEEKNKSNLFKINDADKDLLIKLTR